MPLTSINTRLWLSYTLLICLVLIAALAGILFAFQTSPLLYRQIFLRIDLVSNLLTERLAFVIDADWDPTIQLFFSEAKLLDVQVAILDTEGNVLFSTASQQEFQVPEIKDLTTITENSSERILTFRDSNKTDWFYQTRAINSNYYLLAAAKRPDFEIQTLFHEELLAPLIRAGFLALAGAFIISWFMAKWITRPLMKISQSAEKIAVGTYETVPIEGPSEVRQLALVINDMSHKVEDSLKSQKDFVANVSHELKTPLTSIQGFSQAVYDGTVHTKKDVRHAAEVVLNETDRLNVLVDDLLTLAKLDAGTMAMTKTEIEINELVKNVVERFRFEFEKKEIKLLDSYTKPVYLVADGTRLAQVFSNLVDNAIKFSKPKSSVKTNVSRNGNSVLFSVTDSGPGISEKEIKRIFERFYQIDKSRSGGTGRGIGLGLAIAKQIVEAHEGEISVSSKVGEGSTFMVKLPIEDATKKKSSD